MSFTKLWIFLAINFQNFFVPYSLPPLPLELQLCVRVRHSDIVTQVPKALIRFFQSFYFLLFRLGNFY